MPEYLPPALILLAAAVLIGLVRGHLRSAVVLIAPLLTLWAVWQIPDGVVTTAPFLDYTIEPVEGSPLRRLFATIFALMAFVGGLYAFRQAKWYELSAAFAYAAGAVGVSFAGDLITLFVYWELTAIASVFLIWANRSERSTKVGMRYLVIQIGSGVLLLAGALLGCRIGALMILLGGGPGAGDTPGALVLAKPANNRNTPDFTLAALADALGAAAAVEEGEEVMSPVGKVAVSREEVVAARPSSIV